MVQAFSDIRIIDFSQVLAGPFATQQLALLGADVIKIEQPGKGDQIRQMMSNDALVELGISPSYLNYNMNKRGISLDLKADDAKEIVARLIASADVVIENFKAGVIERLGFGYDFARSVKPDIIYCSISGYGQTGPKRGEAAYDGAIQAASGMMSITGYPDSGPVRTGYMPVDISTGLTAAFAISAALYQKKETGEGRFIDVAMMDTAITLQGPKFAGYTVSGVEPELQGNDSPTNQPTGNVFPTADGYIQITALVDRQVAKLFRVLGLETMIDDPRFADPMSRLAHPVEIRDAVVEKLAADGTENWVRKLSEAEVPVAPIQNYRQVMAEPQMQHRDVFVEVEAPAGLGGTVKLVGAGFKMSAGGPAARRRAPDLGQHTDEVLSEIGYNEPDIAAMRARGAL